ncbi:MAG TPA: hypothetical protein VMF59_10660, partial [Bacteroidota bacterium]|nr:hypothetical protein [Bacteroidota bacterium]
TNSPTGPRSLVPPSFAFSPGQVISYARQNFDDNHNPVSSYQHDVEVLSTGRTIGGVADAATAGITTSWAGGVERHDTVTLALEGGKLLIYDPSARSGGGYPALPLWNTLVDLNLNAAQATLLGYDSTFTVPMVSGHTLRDRVTCTVETHYAGEDRIPAFGAPIVNCFVFTRSVYLAETVDTGGVTLFQGSAVALLDSVWFADGIGPVRWTSRGSAFELDSLGLPFSLSALQVLATPSSFDSYEVHYTNAGGRDLLLLRRSLYDVAHVVYTVTDAFAKNF